MVDHREGPFLGEIMTTFKRGDKVKVNAPIFFFALNATVEEDTSGDKTKVKYDVGTAYAGHVEMCPNSYLTKR